MSIYVCIKVINRSNNGDSWLILADPEPIISGCCLKFPYWIPPLYADNNQTLRTPKLFIFTFLPLFIRVKISKWNTQNDFSNYVCIVIIILTGIAIIIKNRGSRSFVRNWKFNSEYLAITSCASNFLKLFRLRLKLIIIE